MGRKITGTNADRTGGTWTNLAAGWIFFETDTGNGYYWNGSAWVTLFGPSATITYTNKTLTSPIISTISNTGTLTLPTSTDTLVGRATTDTLTNKTLTSPTITTPLLTYTDVTKVNTDSPYSILTTDRVIRLNATSGAITATLPTAVGVAGKKYAIRRVDILASTVLVTIATTSSQTIAGCANYYLWPGESITVESDGANWEVIAEPNRGVHNYYMLKNTTNDRRYFAGGLTQVSLVTSTTSPAANTLWALPLIVPKVTKFDQISFRLTTAGAANARAGIYRDTGNCYPGALIFDTGSIDCSSGTVKNTTITAGLQVFPPGLYWLTWECDAATLQINSIGSSAGPTPILGENNSLSVSSHAYGYSVAHTFGALPDPYTASATILAANVSATNPVPAVGLRPI